MTAARPAARGRRTAWLLAVMAGMLLLYSIEIAVHVLPAGESELFQKFITPAVFFGAAALCALKARASEAERGAWSLLALALALWAVAQTYWVLYLWDSADPPFPSPADGFWIAFYLPAYGALYKLLRQRSGSAKSGVWLDAWVGGLGVGGAGAALAFQVVLDTTSGSPAAIATNLAYPVGDLGLVALVVVLLTVTGWKASGAWRWVAAAFVVFVAADSTYLVQVAQGSYTAGGVVDLGWPAAALLVGVAAWRPELAVSARSRTRDTIVVAGLFGFAALALLVVDHFSRTNLLAVCLASASLFMVLVRLYRTVQDNRRMLAQSRLEATTDALTGLGNRRQLREDLAKHAEEFDPQRPLMLTLFDLDGFKHYNDTFGHLAGDELLHRLGAKLSELLTGQGTAYRMGGDEFCALWSRSDADQASVTTMDAVAALSERGEAFTISCSYGSVLLPNEATDPTDALQIADRRMYLRKGNNGRASAGRQSSDVLLRALTEGRSEMDADLIAVADLACATALRLGMPVEEMEATRQTALLSDVGQVAIPDGILHKPGPLAESDAGFIRRHTVIGERIIAAAPALAAVARLVRSTHEHYDGSGYPDGLVGEDIPLIARIVTVCGAYDAMVSERAYREAWDMPTAIGELRRCSGTQFDPEVVEAFAAALGATRRAVLATAETIE
jgi:two-component system cell cycle response regulator